MYYSFGVTSGDDGDPEIRSLYVGDDLEEAMKKAREKQNEEFSKVVVAETHGHYLHHWVNPRFHCPGEIINFPRSNPRCQQ